MGAKLFVLNFATFIFDLEQPFSRESRIHTTLFYYLNFIQSCNNNKIHKQLFTGVLRNT